MLHRVNLLLDLYSFLLDLLIDKINFLDIDFMLEAKKLLHIISLELENRFILGVDNFNHLLLLFFDLLLEVHIVIGRRHQSNS